MTPLRWIAEFFRRKTPAVYPARIAAIYCGQKVTAVEVAFDRAGGCFVTLRFENGASIQARTPLP